MRRASLCRKSMVKWRTAHYESKGKHYPLVIFPVDKVTLSQIAAMTWRYARLLSGSQELLSGNKLPIK